MNIFIANLNFRIRGQRLKEVFSEFGEVTFARVILDRKTRKSKGFGFVEMPNDEEATKAITALNGTEIDGRAVVVQQAKQKDISEEIAE